MRTVNKRWNMSESGVKSFSSFQKRSANKNISISGTKPSLSNNQLLISIGIPSLDNFLGKLMIWNATYETSRRAGLPENRKSPQINRKTQQITANQAQHNVILPENRKSQITADIKQTVNRWHCASYKFIYKFIYFHLLT